MNSSSLHKFLITPPEKPVRASQLVSLGELLETYEGKTFPVRSNIIESLTVFPHNLSVTGFHETVPVQNLPLIRIY